MNNHFKSKYFIILFLCFVFLSTLFIFYITKLELTNKMLTSNFIYMSSKLRETNKKLEIKLLIADIVTNYEYKKVTATCYSPSIDETDDTPFITASGDSVHTKHIAVARDLYKNGWTFNRVVYIKEHNEFYIVKDLMNRRFENRIDFFAWTKPEAMKFGKKILTAYLIY